MRCKKHIRHYSCVLICVTLHPPPAPPHSPVSHYNLFLSLSSTIPNDDRSDRSSRDTGYHFKASLLCSGLRFLPTLGLWFTTSPVADAREGRVGRVEGGGIHCSPFLSPLSHFYLWHLQHDRGHGVTPGTMCCRLVHIVVTLTPEVDLAERSCSVARYKTHVSALHIPLKEPAW